MAFGKEFSSSNILFVSPILKLSLSIQHTELIAAPPRLETGSNALLLGLLFSLSALHTHTHLAHCISLSFTHSCHHHNCNVTSLTVKTITLKVDLKINKSYGS